jgi:hypothetical protein
VVEDTFIDRLRADIDAEIQTLIDVARNEVGIRGANNEYKSRRRRIRAELREAGLDDPNPWPDLWRWYGHYSGDGSLGTYQARRELVLESYQPLLDSLEGLEERRLGTGISVPATGWTEVDRQVAALHTSYARAHTPEEYRQVGLLCRDIFVSLGHVVFDGAKHLPPGKDPPRGDDAKNRLELAVLAEYGGGPNEKLRALVRSTWDFAQPIVHDRTDDQTKAMLAADATIHLQKVLAVLFPNPTGFLPAETSPDDEEEPDGEPSLDDLRAYQEWRGGRVRAVRLQRSLQRLPSAARRTGSACTPRARTCGPTSPSAVSGGHPPPPPALTRSGTMRVRPRGDRPDQRRRASAR